MGFVIPAVVLVFALWILGRYAVKIVRAVWRFSDHIDDCAEAEREASALRRARRKHQ